MWSLRAREYFRENMSRAADIMLENQSGFLVFDLGKGVVPGAAGTVKQDFCVVIAIVPHSAVEPIKQFMAPENALEGGDIK